MHIGIDGRALSNWRGFGVYLRELLAEIDRLSKHQVTLFVDADQSQTTGALAALPQAWRRIILPPSGRSAFWREEMRLPRFYRDHPVDVFFHPDNNVCWHGRQPMVVTWHDSMVEMFPDYFFGRHPWRRTKGQLAHWLKLQLLRHAASRVITVSESSKRDLCRIGDVAPERVVVVHNGVHPRFRPPTDDTLADRLQQDHGLTPGYILYAGGLNPHKNVEALIRAYATLLDRPLGGTLPPLVLAGKLQDPENPYIVTSARQLQDLVRQLGLTARVHFLGYVPPDEHLVTLYQGAAMLVFPSLYEGFGLPVAEALACGTPVVTANRSSLPEVAGDAALLIDPTSVPELAGAMARLLTDPALAQQLREAGPRQAARFRWETTARQTLAVLEAAVAVQRTPAAAPAGSPTHTV
ncbi:MAG: glycosyltransferase family 4 protein [Candidatus Sericytochromatia bacterium]|nr:glycosyltransferase family 4 protein [Candidatus Sericytochromatia bacterium]